MAGLLFRSLNASASAPTINVSSFTVTGNDGGIVGGSTFGALEPVVMHDGTKFLLWYHRVVDASDASPVLYYAESTDGETFTGHTQVSLSSNIASPEVYFDGTTYHLLVRNTTSGSIDYYTSTSPSSGFTRQKAGAITTGSAGQWDSFTIYNPSIFYEGGTWYVFYEGNYNGRYQVGLATGSDMSSLTKQGVVITRSGGSVNAPCVKKVGATYYALCHRGDGDTTTNYGLPSSMSLWKSASLTSGWTEVGWFGRVYNVSTARGEQIADPYICTVGGTTHVFWEQIPDQTTDFRTFKLCHGTYSGDYSTLETLITDSPVSDTAPTLSSGKVTVTLNSGAIIGSVTMDGVAASAVGSSGAVTPGTYFRSGTTLVLGTSGKSKVTIGSVALSLAASTAWSLSGSTITVNDTQVGTRSTVQATVTSSSGGRLVFSGADASRFQVSLDGSSWSSVATLSPGTTTLHLGCTRQSGDPTLSASVGIPR